MLLPFFSIEDIFSLSFIERKGIVPFGKEALLWLKNVQQSAVRRSLRAL